MRPPCIQIKLFFPPVFSVLCQFNYHTSRKNLRTMGGNCPLINSILLMEHTNGVWRLMGPTNNGDTWRQGSWRKGTLYMALAVVFVQSLTCERLFVTLWAVARQAPLSMEFSRQEHWSGLPFPLPGDLPDPGIEPACSA